MDKKVYTNLPEKGVYDALRFGGIGTVKDIQKRLEMRREHHTIETLKDSVKSCLRKGLISRSDILGAYKARNHG